MTKAIINYVVTCNQDIVRVTERLNKLFSEPPLLMVTLPTPLPYIQVVKASQEIYKGKMLIGMPVNTSDAGRVIAWETPETTGHLIEMNARGNGMIDRERHSTLGVSTLSLYKPASALNEAAKNNDSGEITLSQAKISIKEATDFVMQLHEIDNETKLKQSHYNEIFDYAISNCNDTLAKKASGSSIEALLKDAREKVGYPGVIGMHAAARITTASALPDDYNIDQPTLSELAKHNFIILLPKDYVGDIDKHSGGTILQDGVDGIDVEAKVDMLPEMSRYRHFARPGKAAETAKIMSIFGDGRAVSSNTRHIQICLSGTDIPRGIGTNPRDAICNINIDLEKIPPSLSAPVNKEDMIRFADGKKIVKALIVQRWDKTRDRYKKHAIAEAKTTGGNWKQIYSEYMSEFKKNLLAEFEVYDRAFELTGFSGYDYSIPIIALNLCLKNINGEYTVGVARGSGAGSAVLEAGGASGVKSIVYGLMQERYIDVDRIAGYLKSCIEDMEKEIPDIINSNKDGTLYEQVVAELEKLNKDTYEASPVFQKIIESLSRTGDSSMIDKLSFAYKNGIRIGDYVAEAMHKLKGDPADYDNDTMDQTSTVITFDKVCSALAAIKDDADKTIDFLKRCDTHGFSDPELDKIISENPATNDIPPIESHIPTITTSNNEKIAALDHRDMEPWWMEIKYDQLGLAGALKVLFAMLELIKKEHPGDEIITPYNVDTYLLEHPELREGVVNLSQSGINLGIHQLTTDTANRVVMEMLAAPAFANVPIVDIISQASAWIRPGAEAEFRNFIDKINGKSVEEKSYHSLPQYKEVTKNELGAIIYQETVMKLAVVIGGFSSDHPFATPNKLRGALSKKKTDVLDKLKTFFIEGGVKNGIDESTLLDLWEDLEKFGGYGFNKSHAASYGLITTAMYVNIVKYWNIFIKAALATKKDPNIGNLKALAMHYGGDLVMPSLLNLSSDVECDSNGVIKMPLQSADLKDKTILDNVGLIEEDQRTLPNMLTSILLTLTKKGEKPVKIALSPDFSKDKKDEIIERINRLIQQDGYRATTQGTKPLITKTRISKLIKGGMFDACYRQESISTAENYLSELVSEIGDGGDGIVDIKTAIDNMRDALSKKDYKAFNDAESKIKSVARELPIPLPEIIDVASYRDYDFIDNLVGLGEKEMKKNIGILLSSLPKKAMDDPLSPDAFDDMASFQDIVEQAPQNAPRVTIDEAYQFAYGRENVVYGHFSSICKRGNLYLSYTDLFKGTEGRRILRMNQQNAKSMWNMIGWAKDTPISQMDEILKAASDSVSKIKPGNRDFISIAALDQNGYFDARKTEEIFKAIKTRRRNKGGPPFKSLPGKKPDAVNASQKSKRDGAAK